jgi:2'-5' RNA ligase
MRLFLAIRLPEPVIQFAVELQERLKPAIARQGVRFASPAKMHLTLAFLGDDMDPDRADSIARSCLAGRGPVQLASGTLGAFPDVARPRAIWLGVNGFGLTELVASLSQALELKDEPYQGHITLARVSPGSKAVGKALKPFLLQDREAITWRVDEVDLLTTGPDGDYQKLNQYFL